MSVSATTNQITSSPETYDASGNMTNDGLNTITYDAESRPVTTTGGLGSGAYIYDGNGLRVKKTVSGTPTVYIFSGSKVIAEYLNGAAPSSPTTEYIYGSGNLLASIGSAGTLYFHQDHLSNRMMTNSTGGVYSQLGHFPSGEQWYDSTYTKWYFTTYEYDQESSNHYALARSYVNRLGRYSSPDAIAGTSTAPQSLNRYAYSTNDPINYFDPFGFCPAGTHPATQKEIQDILKSAQNLIDENQNPSSSQYTESLSQPSMEDNVFDSQGNLVAMDCTHFINLAINQAGYSVPYATTQEILNQTGPGQYFQPNTTSVSVGNVALISFAGQQPYGHAMLVSSVAPLTLLGSQSHTGPATVPNSTFSYSLAANKMSNSKIFQICIPDKKNSYTGSGGGASFPPLKFCLLFPGMCDPTPPRDEY